MKKIDRLFNIVHILINKKHITANALANEFGVSTRTIYRDIDVLSSANIPIYTDKGNGGGIRLLDTYTLNTATLSDGEKKDIIMGLELMQATKMSDVDLALQKLNNLFNNQQESWIDVDFSQWGSNSLQKQWFEEIQHALKNEVKLTLHYCSGIGNETIRDIYPLKLIFKEKHWYLIGFCLLKQDYRLFRISRIRKLILTEEQFNRENYDSNNIKFDFGKSINEINITLTLSNACLFRVQEEFLSEMIHPYNEKDETIQVTFNAEHNVWTISYILSFGEHLLDVQPLRLKEDIKRQIMKLREL